MAASLLPNRPKNGAIGGECVAYAGMTCFGLRFGANTAKDIWYNTTTNDSKPLPYTKYDTMPSLPCCIVWGNGSAGHVGVIESSTGSGSNKKYRFSDSNRKPRMGDKKVEILTNQSEDDIQNLVTDFLGYVKFD